MEGVRFAVINSVEHFVLRITIDLGYTELLSDIGEEIGVFVSRMYLIDHRWNGDDLCVKVVKDEAEVASERKIRHDSRVEYYR